MVDAVKQVVTSEDAELAERLRTAGLRPTRQRLLIAGPRDQQPLARRAQSGGAQTLRQLGVLGGHNLFHCIDHSVQKDVGSATACQ